MDKNLYDLPPANSPRVSRTVCGSLQEAIDRRAAADRLPHQGWRVLQNQIDITSN
ncbi:MAG: hypothetical protein U1E15_07770 [Hyphomicrobiales bacterium]